jgi:hypothetical protein
VPGDSGPMFTACSGNGLSCSYAEGVCGCEPLSGGDAVGVPYAWFCTARSSVAAFTDGDPLGQQCPAKRPLAGDGCASERENCRYDDQGVSLGPAMICFNGYWEFEDTDSPSATNVRTIGF